EGMCREDKGLIDLPVAEGYGVVVGRLRPGAPVDIDDYLGPGLAEELALLDFADWTLFGEPHIHEVGANWKVTLDTYRENYHFDFLHRDTLASYAYGGGPPTPPRSQATPTAGSSPPTPSGHTSATAPPSDRSTSSGIDPRRSGETSR